MRKTILLIGATFLLAGCATPQSQLIGTWRIIETTVNDGTIAATNSSPEPGIYIFTSSHFSNMLILGDVPRSAFSSSSAPEERLAAYDVFIADAGTYEATDKEFYTHNIIAKVPNVMPPYNGESFLTYRYKFDSSNLIITLIGGWAPQEGEITYRMERLE